MAASRRLLRAVLLAVSVAGLANAARLGWAISADVHASLVTDRAVAEIGGRVERMLARHATPARVAATLDVALAAPRRDWIVIDAWTAVADERGIDLPPALAARLAETEAHDRGLWRGIGACGRCAIDLESCTLSAVLLCRIPVEVTPLGDLAELRRAAVDHLAGRPVDPLVAGLAATGLVGTAMTLPSGGSLVSLKAGTRLGRSLGRMGVLSPRLADAVRPSLHRAVDMPRLRAATSLADARRAVDPAALRPLAGLASDLGRAMQASGPLAALRLARHADTPAEARRLANAAQALGPRAAIHAEVLGKTRFLRATVRWSQRAYAWLGAVVSLLLGLGGLGASLAVSAAGRRNRGLARPAADAQGGRGGA